METEITRELVGGLQNLRNAVQSDTILANDTSAGMVK